MGRGRGGQRPLGTLETLENPENPGKNVTPEKTSLENPGNVNDHWRNKSPLKKSLKKTWKFQASPGMSWKKVISYFDISKFSPTMVDIMINFSHFIL